MLRLRSRPLQHLFPSASTRVNFGCGQTPVSGWRNFDNSPCVKLARVPVLARLLCRLGMLQTSQLEFVECARRHGIEYADARRRFSIPSGSVEVFYSSHMLEHLCRHEAASFLSEVRRVLRPGGILRLAVPDLRRLIECYVATEDADRLVIETELAQYQFRGFRKRLEFVLIGGRGHHWMYDGKTLCRLVAGSGFVRASVVPPGQTRIPHPEPLDLGERVENSVYVEAEKEGTL